MPLYFWNDHDRRLYHRAYFERFPHVWHHGDFMIIHQKTHGITMLGRSDSTLNPAGVRFGSSELYSVIEHTIGSNIIEDSLAVGQKRDTDERVILFVKMAQGVSFTSELEQQLRTIIRQKLSPRHVPAIILPIKDIPYTFSGKKVEIAVKRILSGDDRIIYTGTIANPEALGCYYHLPALK